MVVHTDVIFSYFDTKSSFKNDTELLMILEIDCCRMCIVHCSRVQYLCEQDNIDTSYNCWMTNLFWLFGLIIVINANTAQANEYLKQ